MNTATVNGAVNGHPVEGDIIQNRVNRYDQIWDEYMKQYPVVELENITPLQRSVIRLMMSDIRHEAFMEGAKTIADNLKAQI